MNVHSESTTMTPLLGERLLELGVERGDGGEVELARDVDDGRAARRSRSSGSDRVRASRGV